MEYVLLVSFVSLYSLTSVVRTNSRLAALFVCGVLILFAGTRYETGNDWGDYLRAFNSVPPSISEALSLEHRIEPGYLLLNALAKMAGGELWWVFLACAAFTVTTFYFAISTYTPFVALAMLLFMRYGYLQFDMMFVRQGITVAIFFYSVQFICGRRVYIYCLLILVSSMFHVSAVILFPLYAFAHREFNRAAVVGALLLALAVGQTRWLESVVATLPIEGGKLAAVKAYALSDIWGVPKLLSFSFFEKLAVIAFCLIHYDKLKACNQYFVPFFNLSVISFSMSLLFSNYLVFVERLGIIFNISFVVIISYFSYLLSQRDRLIFLVSVSAFVSFWLIRYVHTSDVYLPYKSILTAG